MEVRGIMTLTDNKCGDSESLYSALAFLVWGKHVYYDIMHVWIA